MDYLRTKQAKILIGLAALFILFQTYNFFRVYIKDIDLPKGRVVFYSPIDGDYEVYVMDVRGRVNQLTKNVATFHDSAIDDSPSFSPNGKEIIFTSGRQGQDTDFIYDYQGKIIGTQSTKTGTSDIYVMDSNGNNQTPLTYKELNFDSSFSPDGENIIFTSLKSSKRQKEIMNIYGNNRRVLNINPGHCWFSPDGRKIYDTFQCDLSIMNIDGANRTRLTNLLASEEFMRDPKKRKMVIYNLAFSHNGKKIAFVLKENKGAAFGEFYNITRFYTMDIDGSDLKEVHKIDCSNLNIQYIPDNLERVTHCDIKQFRYSQDDQSLIYIADLNYKKGIYSLNLFNGDIKELTYRKQAWNNILDFILTPDGRKIVFVANIYPKFYTLHALVIRNIKAYVNYYLFKKSTPFYDNKYLCIIDIDGNNYRRIAKLPEGTELGRDFIHWEK